MDFEEKLNKFAGGRLKLNEPLAQYTTFQVGGPAKYFCLAESPKQLTEIIGLLEKKEVVFFVLGGGSNVLINDRGFDGVVIKPVFGRIKKIGNKLDVEAGALLSKAVGEAMSAGLSGLEWAAGIPGTVGGAIGNNAGAYGGEMAQSVETVTVLRRGKKSVIKNSACGFGYRASIFKGKKDNGIIISVVLRLRPADKETIRARMNEILKERKNKFAGEKCAGSIFKNIVLTEAAAEEFRRKFPDCPEEFVAKRIIPAAWLIDWCELKGRKVGGAAVSDKHAGIIINEGNATAEEIVSLISIIKQRVSDHFGLQLEEEVEYVGF